MGPRSSKLRRRDDATLLEASVWASELGAYEWDIDTDTVRWLNTWCQHHGIDPCDGPKHGVRWRAMVHPDDRAVARREFDAHLAGRRDRYECEYRIRTLSGDWRWIRNRAYLRRGAGRRHRMLMGVCFDVDERRRLEFELDRSRRNLEALAAAAPVWMMLLDPEGVVEFVNRTVRGIAPRELVGRSVFEVLSDPAEAQAVREFQARVLAAHAPQMLTTVLDDGRSIGTWATPVVTGGRVTGIASVSVDLSERRSRERDLLEAVTREQRRFGHDLHDGLGQELTGIALLVKTLVKRADNEVPALRAGLVEVLDYVTTAIATSREVARGAAPADLENGGLPRALAELVRRWPNSTAVRIECKLEPGAGALLDPLAAENLYRIAQESINNAARHSGASEVRVHLGYAAPASRSGVRLSVEDDGSGIRAGEALESGIGLRIMRARAELIGAVLRVGECTPRGTRIECVREESARRRPRSPQSSA